MTFSFIACLTIAIGTPLGIRWYISNATQALQVAFQPRAGIATFQEQGRGVAGLINDIQEVTPKSRIVLESDDAEALLLFYVQEQPDTPVSTLQLYGETDVTFISAKTPKFSKSQQPHRVSLQVNACKKLRVSVGGDDRTATLHIETPKGEFDLGEGSYILAVDAERTEITVSRGHAYISDPLADEFFVLSDFQSTELTEKGLGEVLTTGGQLGLVRNDNFDQDLSPHWEAYTRAKEFVNESNGTVQHTENERKTVIFERNGVGHIETGITQAVNQNIEGATALHVTAILKVDQQSIPFCGASATECPVMIRITYLDAQGGSHEWLQGFYAVEGGGYSDVCAICEGRPQHILVPRGAWYTYTSPDLLPLLMEREIEPVAISSVDVYASGHSFLSAIDEIAVLVEE